MKVCLDIRVVTSRGTGVGCYARNLARELAGWGEGLELCLLAGRANLEALGFDPAGARIIPTRVAHESHPLGDVWENLVLPGRLARAGVEVLHGPAVLAPLKRAPFKKVVTIHDLVPLVCPETVPRKYAMYMGRLLRGLARRADRIITDSEASRRDILRLLEAERERISVTPLAAGPEFRPVDDPAALEAVLRRYGIAGRFVLYLGNLEPRKNLLRLAAAFRRVRAELGEGLKLVIGGQEAWLVDRLKEGWQELGLGREVLFTGFVRPEDLPLLMNAATVFAFPSQYEGFGLPVLEALACGVPVITSNKSSLPEVAGDAALLVDPSDVGAIAEAIKRVLTDEALAARLRRAGPRRAAEFSWRRTAELTVEAYQLALDGEARA